ncbi:MAG: hypothetical protein L0211_00060 [Planctomycetaceae bacterium]|nr:hypothetical protein [Planctomycetaceae bacterium]
MAAAFDPYYTWLGIRPEEQPANHYRLLGLRRLEDEPDVITNAIDQRVNYLRTVQSGAHATLAQRLIEEVQAAGDCLIDPRQKARYDRELLARIEQAAAQPAAPVAVPTSPAAPLVTPPPAEPIRALPLPVSFPSPARPLKSPATKADPNTQIVVVVAGLVAVAIVGVAVIAAARWLRTSTPEVVSRPIVSPASVDPVEGPAPQLEKAPLPEPAPVVQPADRASAPIAATISLPAEVQPAESLSPSQPPAPQVSLEKQTIDLLATPNDQLRLAWGKLTRVGNALVLEGKGNALEFPQPLPDEYALEIEVIRELGDNSLCCTLPVGDRVLTAIVDGFYSKVSGLAAIDDHEIFTANSPHAVPGKQLTNHRPATVRIEVSQQLVRLLVDGKLVTEWARDERVPIRAAKGMGVTDPRKLTIFTWDARYRFRRIALTALASEQ